MGGPGRGKKRSSINPNQTIAIAAMARRLFSTARRFLTLMGIFSHVAAGGCKARAVFRRRRLLIPLGMIRPQSLNQKLLFKIERNKSQIRGQIDACGLNLHELPIDWQSGDAGQPLRATDVSTRQAAALIVALAISLSGCGGSDNGSSSCSGSASRGVPKGGTCVPISSSIGRSQMPDSPYGPRM